VGYILDSKTESELESLKRTLEQNLDKLQKTSNHIVNCYKSLDPKKHSLGIVILLFAKACEKYDKDFQMCFEHFLCNLDQYQVSKVSYRFTSIVHFYTEQNLKSGNPSRVLKYLNEAVKRFRPSNDCLTGIHGDFLAVCLKSFNLNYALPVLEQQIFDIQPDRTGCTPKDMLLYYYYGGMIYLAKKEYEKAMNFFEVSLTIPSYALNAIMVESFKKYVLTSLIYQGKYTGIPKNASSIVHRHMKLYCSAYLEFSIAFDKHDTVKCVTNSQQFQELYKKDNNLGLIKQCLSALSRNTIQRLTETYLTLSLSDIAKLSKLSSPQEAEKILFSMIENGEIKAKINQKNKMVSFIEDSVGFNSKDTNSILDGRIDQSIQLFHKIKKIDQDIGKSLIYIAKVNGIREDMLELGPSSKKGTLSKLFDMFR